MVAADPNSIEKQSSNSPRAARSREKVLRAATDLLVESGPRSVTVDAVAEASGVAKSTMYRHWPSRNALLIEVVRSSCPATFSLKPGVDFSTALRSVLSHAAEAFANEEWSRIFPAITSLCTSMPELESLIGNDIEAKKAVLAEIIALGVAEGALAEPVDVHDAAHLLFGPIAFAAITAASTGTQRGRLAELAEYVADRFIASYRAEARPGELRPGNSA